MIVPLMILLITIAIICFHIKHLSHDTMDGFMVLLIMIYIPMIAVSVVGMMQP